MKKDCCEFEPVDSGKQKKIKETIFTEADIGCLGYVCIKPDIALKGDILKDDSYIIKVLRDGFGIVIDISRRIP